MTNRTRLNLERLETRDAPAADVVISEIQLRLPGDIVVPGDSIVVRVDLTNVSAPGPDSVYNPERLPIGIHLYLSDSGEPGDHDFLLGKFQDIRPTLGPGKSQTFNTTLPMPQLSIPLPELAEGRYQVIAEIGRALHGDNPNNNEAVGEQAIDYRFWFGDVGNRKNVTLESNPAADFSLKGGGTGKLVQDVNGFDLNLEGTGPGSSVTIAGGATLQDVTATSHVKLFNMPQGFVRGDMNFPSGVGTLVLRELGADADGATLTVGAGVQKKPTTLAFVRLQGADITVQGGIGIFTASEWLDSGNVANGLKAWNVRTMRIAPGKGTGLSGDFEAHLQIDGPSYDKSGRVLGNVFVQGAVRNSFWNINGGQDRKIQIIKAGSADKWHFEAEGRVDRLEIAGDATGRFGTSFRAAGFGSLEIAGTVDITTISADAADPKTNESIGTLVLGNVVNLSSISARAGGIKSIVFGDRTFGGDWAAKTRINAIWVGDITTKTKSSGDEKPVFRADLRLTGRRPAPNNAGYGLKKVQLPNVLIDGDWEVFGPVGTITAGSATGWQLTAWDAVEKIDVAGQVVGSSRLRVVKTLKELKIGVLAGSDVEANQIDKVTIDAVDTSAPNAYGVVSKRMGRYKRGPVQLAAAELSTPGVKDTAGAYTLTILPPV